MYSSLGKPISLSQLSSSVCSFLCRAENFVGWCPIVFRVHCFHHCTAHIWTVTWWDLVSVIYDISRRHNLTENFLTLWLLKYFHPSSTIFPYTSVRECFEDVSVETEFQNPTFWLVVVFWCGLCRLKREVSLMSSDNYTYL